MKNSDKYSIIHLGDEYGKGISYEKTKPTCKLQLPFCRRLLHHNLYEKPQNAILGNVGATIGRPPAIHLSPYGKIVEEAIQNISEIYSALNVDRYVIMPNHIHLLITISADEYGRPMVAPTISQVVQQMKGYISKRTGYPIWQKLFYDHIIRNQEDYDKHLKYIQENPICWTDDELYMP